MIHRHKHEMTLKFSSIKSDNMLSGERLRLPFPQTDGTSAGFFLLVAVSVWSVFAGVFFAAVTHLPRTRPVCHLGNFMARLRHLFTM